MLLMGSATQSDNRSARSAWQDLLLLAASALIVPGVWMGFLHWDARYLLTGADGFAQVLLVAKELSQAEGSWEALLYRSTLLGGVRIGDTGHVYLPLQALIRLGLAPIDAVNALAMWIQVVFGFFGARLVGEWIGVFDPSPRSLIERAWTGTLGIVLFAFAPWLAWRIGFGHFNLALAGASCLAVFALWTAWLRGSLTLPLIWLGVAVVASGVISAGQQVLVYAVFFGLPIGLALALDLWRSPGGQSRFTNAVLLAVFLLSAVLVLGDRYANLWAYAFGSDTPRPLGSASLVHSYTQRGGDWLLSLPWALTWIPDWRSVMEWHEHYFAFGPLLVALLLVPWKRLPVTGVALLLASSAVLLFGSDVFSISDVMVRMFPPLAAFRAPGRAVLVVYPLLMTLAIAGLVARVSFHAVAIAVALILAWLLPEGIREGVLWLGFVMCLASSHHKHVHSIAISAAFAFAVVSSVLAYGQRRVEVPQRAEYEDAVFTSGVEQAFPDTKQAWVRGVGEYPERIFDSNQSAWHGLSTIEGYWYPTSRFQALSAALRGVEPKPDDMNFRFRPGRPFFPVIRDLYNVRYRLIADGSRIGLEDLGPRLGSTWFATDLQHVASFTELSSRLLEQSSNRLQGVSRTAWIVDSDPATSGIGAPSGDCSRARVGGVVSRLGGQRNQFSISSGADCVLVLATNFTELFVATRLDTGATLQTFPVQGALTGIVVPRGTYSISLNAEPAVPLFPFWIKVSGASLFALASLLFSLRARRSYRYSWASEHPAFVKVKL